MGTPQYIDISSWNSMSDWHAYKAWASQWDGISRVAIRSSEGTGVEDAKFAQYRADALSVGIDVIIFYHYAYPNLNDAGNEALWQQQVVGQIRPQDVIMLDYEENVPQATSQWALEWLATQQGFYKRLPTIYSYPSFIANHLQDPRLAQYPLTYANWQFTPDERPAAPHPWASYEYLQYSDKALNIPGVSGAVDANIYLGPGASNTMGITITTPVVSDYFTQNAGGEWICKKNGHIIHGDVLKFYQAYPGVGLAGFTDLGLPLSNEIPLDTLGNTKQEFERGDLHFDPKHVHDDPPGAGAVYKAHIPQDAPPSNVPVIKSELLALVAQL